MAAGAGTDSLFGRIGEYFTLSAARAAQGKLGEPARKAIDQALGLGRQRADAAESLWSNGHTAEALRLATRSLEDTLAAAPAYARAMGLAAAAPAPSEAPAGALEPATVAPEAATVAPEAATVAPEAATVAPEAATVADEATSSSSEVGAAASPAEGRVDAPADETSQAAPSPESSPAAPAKRPGANEVEAQDDWSAALRARGASKAHLDKVRAALAASRAASLPLLDAEVSAAHADLFQQALDARHLVDRSFGMVALPSRDLGWTRFSRIGTTSLIAAVVLVGLYVGLRTPEGIFADASDVWAQSPMFAAENVIDGNEDSYWLLPDGATGWVEARISPAVDISRVRLLNTHNPPHNDRATQAYAVEIYSGGELAQTIEGTFEFSTRPEFVTHEISVGHVDRIRFVARSHHHVGAGLAELQWE
jgi:hypothetical protein